MLDTTIKRREIKSRLGTNRESIAFTFLATTKKLIKNTFSAVFLSFGSGLEGIYNPRYRVVGRTKPIESP